MSMIRPKRVDLRRLSLTPLDGLVLTSLEGPVSLSQLVAISGIEEERLVGIVERLRLQGALEIEADPPSRTVPAPPPLEFSTEFAAIDELGVLGEGAPIDAPEVSRVALA